ncbi:hypothetical protein PHET_02876 [Paragonimus heterotremus]|uniref:Uncharacterized protein n=1 Tax=Paragonimus heterotremus TaxID=100268 RepID=A0A8J4SRU8_9TREM|nr:hypothetical protein PHET_02876 [Paragonimus heterotremus]
MRSFLSSGRHTSLVDADTLLPSNLNPDFALPRCMKNPLRVERLKKHTHLSLLGLVFDVSVYEELYGSKGSLAKLTGHNEIHHFCQSTVSGGFALDGLSELQLIDILRWLQFISSNYQCVGYLPGVYFDPFGEPTAYMHNILHVFKSIAMRQAGLAALFPDCQSKTIHGKPWAVCPALPSRDSQQTELMVPRKLVDPSQSRARCVCVQSGLLNHPWIREYPNCNRNSPVCELST